MARPAYEAKHKVSQSNILVWKHPQTGQYVNYTNPHISYPAPELVIGKEVPDNELENHAYNKN